MYFNGRMYMKGGPPEFHFVWIFPLTRGNPRALSGILLTYAR
jgi:hypothetical protein